MTSEYVLIATRQEESICHPPAIVFKLATSDSIDDDCDDTEDVCQTDCMLCGFTFRRHLKKYRDLLGIPISDENFVGETMEYIRWARLLCDECREDIKNPGDFRKECAWKPAVCINCEIYCYKCLWRRAEYSFYKEVGEIDKDWMDKTRRYPKLCHDCYRTHWDSSEPGVLYVNGRERKLIKNANFK